MMTGIGRIGPLGLIGLVLAIAAPAWAGEEPDPELVTDAEIAELRALAEQARAGTLPGMMPKAEIERLRAALKLNPKTPAEARLLDYRTEVVRAHDALITVTNTVLSAPLAQRPAAHLQMYLRDMPATRTRLAAARLRLDVAEGRVTRATAEAEIKAAQDEIAAVEKARADVEKNVATALNPERHRAEQNAKLDARAATAAERLTAAEKRLAVVKEVLGEDF